MAAEIVHDDDITGLESGHEDLLDIGLAALTVDRPVEDARGRQSVAAQRAEKGQGSPMAMRGKAPEAFAAFAPSPKRRHIGLDPGFIDEHQPAGIEAGLQRLPALTPSGDVGARLLKGEQCFF